MPSPDAAKEQFGLRIACKTSVTVTFKYVAFDVGPQRGIASFARIQRATAELDYHHQETNFTLGLAELATRLKRRALVILFTDFVDTVTAELLIESLQRVANKHVVVFVTQRGSVLPRGWPRKVTRLGVEIPT